MEAVLGRTCLHAFLESVWCVCVCGCVLQMLLNRSKSHASKAHLRTRACCRLGYRTASTEANEPLYFLLVHDRVESL